MNRYEVIDPPVTFKRGEEFEYEGELPKQVVVSLTSCPVLAVGDRPEDLAFPAIDAELLAEAAPDDGVADAPVDQGNHKGCPYYYMSRIPSPNARKALEAQNRPPAEHQGQARRNALVRRSRSGQGQG